MRPSTSFLPRCPRQKIPLLAVLIVPFVMQTIAAVGSVGYFSYRHGQQMTNHLASQLAREVGQRIDQNLIEEIRAAAAMTHSTAAVIQFGALDRRDRVFLQPLFEQQLRHFEQAKAIAYANERRSLFAVGKQPGSMAVTVHTSTGDDMLNRYLTNRLMVESPLHSHPPGRSNLTLDSWYLTAKDTQKPLWRLALGLTPTEQPVLTAVYLQPLYDRVDRFKGVLAASISLNSLSNELRSLKIAKTGQAFIVDQQGLLIANSNGDRPFQQLGLSDKRSALLATIRTNTPVSELAYKRLRADRSYDVLTEQAAASIIEKFGGFSRIQTRQQLSFEVDHQRYFAHIEPLGRDQNLDWLAVVVVPEADLSDAIANNHRVTFWLCVGALAAAIAVSWATASWIAKPILRLSRASRELALGEWNHPIDTTSQIAELEVLAHSFNQMTEHLQQSFDQVITALQESEAKFTKVFRTSPDAIAIMTLPERRYLDVNDRFLEFTGYSREEAIGQNAVDLKLIVQPDQITHFEDVLHTHNRVREIEIDYRNKQGQLRTVLVSAEVLELEGQKRLLCIYREITQRKQLELALQRSETKLNDILIGAIASITSIHIFPDGSWHYDYWSKGCETVFGYSPETFMADQTLWRSLVLPEDLEQVLVCNPKWLQNQQAMITQYRFRHRDGTLRWISGYVTARWDEALQGWIATVVDVDVSNTMRLEAERKQAEAALRRSEATLREAQRVAHIGSWEFDVIANTTRWSEELFQIHGLDPEQPLLNPVETLQFIHTDDRAALINLVSQAVSTRKAYERDLRIVRPDGSIRYVEVRGMPLFDEQGTYIRMVGTTLDITERKQAEEALRQSEQRFRNAFDTTAVSMCLTSPQGRFLQVNASLCQLLGYSEAELLAMTFAELTHPDDLPLTLAYAQKLLSGELAYYHLEKRYQHKDGHTIWCLLSVSLVRDREEQPLYFVAQMLPGTHSLQSRVLALTYAPSVVDRHR
ncbi:MAG: PAS domain S-box protein [Lyngbya sp. HA4199-MV5]|nr:PAS domain S-box protein [Lyngbya sp. HA4199-MV5]